MATDKLIADGARWKEHSLVRRVVLDRIVAVVLMPTVVVVLLRVEVTGVVVAPSVDMVIKSLIFMLRIQASAGRIRVMIAGLPVAEHEKLYAMIPTKTHRWLDVYIIAGPPESPGHVAMFSKYRHWQCPHFTISHRIVLVTSIDAASTKLGWGIEKWLTAWVCIVSHPFQSDLLQQFGRWTRWTSSTPANHHHLFIADQIHRTLTSV